jgi:hypothetical protein
MASFMADLHMRFFKVVPQRKVNGCDREFVSCMEHHWLISAVLDVSYGSAVCCHYCYEEVFVTCVNLGMGATKMPDK